MTYQTDCFLDKEISQGWEVEKVLEFSYKRGINEAVEGIEDNENNYSIFSVSSSEDSFVYLSQIEIPPRTRMDKKMMTTRSQL